MTDYIVTTRMLSPTSLRPMHDLCLSSEAMRVGQILYCLHRQSAQVLELKTDSVLYRPMKRAKLVLQNLEFQHMSRLRDQFDPVRQKRLDQYTCMAVSTSGDSVYRVQVAEEKDLMKMQPQGPRREERHGSLLFKPRLETMEGASN